MDRLTCIFLVILFHGSAVGSRTQLSSDDVKVRASLAAADGVCSAMVETQNYPCQEHKVTYSYTSCSFIYSCHVDLQTFVFHLEICIIQSGDNSRWIYPQLAKHSIWSVRQDNRGKATSPATTWTSYGLQLNS